MLTGGLLGGLVGGLLGGGGASSITPPLPRPFAANATSSALRLGDMALSLSDGIADLSIVDGDLASDIGMTTAAVLSLFTDRRAEPDDVPPSGDPDDLRGWWADEFADVPGDKFGSRLWLLDRSKRSGETVRKAEEYVREALDWMIADRVADSIDVEITTTANGLLIGVGVNRPGKDRIALKFAHVWS